MGFPIQKLCRDKNNCVPVAELRSALDSSYKALVCSSLFNKFHVYSHGCSASLAARPIAEQILWTTRWVL